MKYKLLILSFFLILNVNNLFAQDSIISTKWSIGLAVSPDFTYRIVPSHNLPDRSVYVTSNYRIKDQIPKGGIHLELLAGYDICKNFIVKSGMNFYCAGFNTKTIYDTIYGRLKEVVGIDSSHQHYSFYYLGIPVWFIGNIICNKKISIDLGAGLAINYFTKNNEVSYIWGNYSKKNSFNAVIIAKVGINYILNKHLSLDISPNFNYFIKQVHDLNARDGDNGINLYSAGIEFGLNYNFDRKMKR